MTQHNKITFAKEYCLCRHIPYKFEGERLIIGKGNSYEDGFSLFSVYNLTYVELIKCIDEYIEYDPITTYFVRVKAKD